MRCLRFWRRCRLWVPLCGVGYASNKIIPNGLAGLLGQEGYHTSFFHGAPNGSMGFDAIANLLGFKEYYGKTEFGNDAEFDGMWGIWDEPFSSF